MRKFSLTGGILNRPITVIMCTLIVVGFGVFSLTNLRVTLFPSLNIPVLAVSSGYQNVAPEDIDRIIVTPIEGAVAAIEGIESLEARVSRGNAFVILRLYEGTDIRKTELKVQKAIDQIRADLPEQAQEPTIFQFDPENRPIMQLSINSGLKGLDELRNLAIDVVEPSLERIVGLASADTRGGLERRIYVDVSPMQLAQHNIVPQELENAIRSNNTQLPMGNVIAQNISYSVRAESMYETVDEIKKTIIKVSDSGIPIRVEDVADVSDGFTEVTSLINVNGNNSVSIEVQKNSDSNTLDVVNAVKAVVPEINEILPPGVELRILSDEGRAIDDSINNLAQSSLFALIVVVLVILVFMGGWRISLVVALSIPVSIAASFATMYAANLTLNIFTISALALAIGLLVDNAIVVAESIARKLEDGMTRYQAAFTGTNEVIGPLFGSTLTTLGVFIPITLISGIQGVFFREFALTISFAIAISFISSIVLVPVLSILVLDRDQFNKRSFMFSALHKLEDSYSFILRWILKHKWIPTLLLLGIITGTFFMYQNIAKEGFPETDSGEIDVDITLQEGTKLVRTVEVMENFENQLLQKPEIETLISSIGRSRWTAQSNRGSFTLQLVPVEEREITSSELAAALRQELVAPGVTVRASVEGGGIRFGGRGFRSGGGSVRLSLIGPEMTELLRISKQIEDKFLEDPNIISVDNGRTDPTPELQFIVDRNRVGMMNAGISEVAGNLRTQTLGNQAGFFRTGGREIPIEVRTAKTALQSREDLFDLEVLQYEDQRIPVVAVGEFKETKGVDSYSKRDREILLDVSIQFDGDANVYRELITDFVNTEVIMPEGYRYEFTGASREAQDGAQQFLFAGLAALVLMFMIMASLFENFRDPFVIWLCIPMALFGALAGLMILGTPLSTTGNIGLFMLVGIIVNNGIVLVDYMHLRTKGMEFDIGTNSDFMNAILEACKRRMRPVLLTAITTICSMIPLSLEFGAGAEIWSPLAKTVIGGLFFGVLFTLFITPAISVGFKQVIVWISNLFQRSESPIPQPT
ncbi:MAG: efflux RND transporter permease subunit [Balneolaceae bacterium]|nr:efflux RND transporter permease subunit [Balneolaceae bacterium]MBO6545984.1 efflux RND transporter permease subunit [Balneolaceae bacterium]MBO6647380.1 efflux RND transporter permease subunit [Balneolaceae bacterium]